jgi:GT2 family glycosyltransferase
MLDYQNPEYAVVACNWKNAELLTIFIDNLLLSLSAPTEVYINLNEASEECIEILESRGVRYIANPNNLGTAAVDLLTPMLKAPWIFTINDDQIPYFGWQDNLRKIAADNWPCCASVTNIEPEFTNNPMVIADDSIGHILELETPKIFRSRCDSGVYHGNNIVGYQHPTIYRTDVWKSVGGYSCGLPFDYFGLAGYCLDDYFNYKVRQYLGPKTNFIVSGKSFCYHQVSNTTKRLPPNIKNFDAQSKFVELTGITTQTFRNSIGWGGAV